MTPTSRPDEKVVRNQRYKLWRDDKNRLEQLYDLDTDPTDFAPLDLNNLSAREAQYLRTRLDAYYQ